MSDGAIHCPNCGKTDIRFREKRNEWLCEDCDHHWTADAPETLAGSVENRSPLKIFLSYGHDQHAADAVRIKADLEQRGHDVWFDLERLQAGRDWEQYIEEGLKQCDKVVLLMTPYSVRRRDRADPQSRDGFCLNEIAKAIERNKLIIPVLLVELDEGPPTSICRIQYLDLCDAVPIEGREAQYQRGFDRLVLAIEQDELDFEGGQARLNRWLQPLNFDAQIAHHVARFSGRTWLFDQMNDWLQHQPESRVFWIVGGPGIGKSAIAAQLCHRRHDVIASHFCVHGHQDKTDPRRVVLSLAYQLAAHLRPYEQKLQSLALEEEQAKTAKTLFDNLIVAPLSAPDFPAPDDPRLVVIDAIDEATSDGRNEVADFIAQNWSQTPAWLRLVITSRPETDVISRLKRPDLQPHVLDARSAENLADLRSFLRSELEKLELTAADHVLDAILDKSEGLFLYVTSVLEELLQGHLSLERMDEFPQGMAGYYHQFFARQFPNPDEYKKHLRPLLSTVIAQREPLPLELLTAAAELTGFELRERLLSLGSLFPVRHVQSGSHATETISPFHKSIGDWLTSYSVETRTFAAGPYAVDVASGEESLASVCWQQYSSSSRGLADYALRHLSSHLVAAGRWDEIETVLTDLLFVEARCRAGLTFDLVSDYNAALAGHPELEAEREAERARVAMLQDYGAKLIQCSKARGEGVPLPAPPDTRPVIERFRQVQANAAMPYEPPETKSGRISEFAKFVSTCSHMLYAASQETLSIARNAACEGLVARRAEPLTDAFMRPWLARDPRPPVLSANPACRRTLQGHARSVNSVAITPDGARAVSASHDHTLKVWDLNTGEQERTLQGHAHCVYSVAITPDGARAVSASYDHTLKVWDLNTGEEERTLQGHTDEVNSVAITPDGARAVSASYDHTLKVWDLNTGEEERTLQGHTDEVNSVAITPDGARAVSASHDHTLKVWDLNTGAEERTLQGHTHCVYSVAITPDGARAVSASRDNTLKVWDLNTGEEERTLQGHTDEVYSVAITPDGARAVSASRDHTLKVWDLNTGEEERTLQGHTHWVYSVAITPDGARAVSASHDNTLKVWDLNNGEEERTLQGHTHWVNSVAITPDGARAVSASHDHTLKVWDLNTGEEERTLQGHTHCVYSVAITPDGARAVSASHDHTLKVWDLNTGEEERTLQGHTHCVYSVAITPDGARAVSASYDHTLKVWDLNTGEEERTLQGHTDEVNSVAITPDGARAVSASYDHTLKVWDLNTGEEERTLQGHTDEVNSVAITSDGTRAVSASHDHTLKVWDLNTGEEERTLQGHTDEVYSVAITPDSARAVSASDDNTLKVWDLNNGECQATHPGQVMSIAVYGRDRIVCGTADGQLHFLTLRNAK